MPGLIVWLLPGLIGWLLVGLIGWLPAGVMRDGAGGWGGGYLTRGATCGNGTVKNGLRSTCFLKQTDIGAFWGYTLSHSGYVLPPPDTAKCCRL